MAAKRKKKKAKKIVLGILIGYVLIMAIGYLGISFYFSSHFLKGTTINGIDCENMTADEVKEEIQNGIGQYRLQLVLIDGATETITAEQLNLQYVDDNKVDELKTEINLDEEGCYLKPSVYQDDAGLVAERDQLNQFMRTDLTYDFGDRTETVNASLIKDWIVKGEDGQYTVDEDKVMEYVKDLAYKYDTFGLAHEFTTSHGEKITLQRGGDYGWVMKKQATADELVQYIKEGKTGTIEPVYLYEGKSRDTNDIGGTYVEISIEEQRMWCYKDGQLIVDTPVVTGNPNKEGCATPAGSVWAIDAKKQGAVLTGEGYTQPVTYWMPFNGNVGIHDADTWRSEYGGEIYKTNGSHGCVNTPTENARKIFEAVEIGTPVIVY